MISQVPNKIISDSIPKLDKTWYNLAAIISATCCICTPTQAKNNILVEFQN